MVDMESAQLNATQVEQISNIMLNGIKSQVLGSLVRELNEYCAVELFPRMKNELVAAAEKIVSETQIELRQHLQKKQFSKEDAMKFMTDNKEAFN